MKITNINFENLEQDYYVINGTKKVLYWDGAKWMKPVKDSRKSFNSGLIGNLDKQPTNVKSIELVSETEFAQLYKFL